MKSRNLAIIATIVMTLPMPASAGIITGSFSGVVDQLENSYPYSSTLTGSYNGISGANIHTGDAISGTWTIDTDIFTLWVSSTPYDIYRGSNGLNLTVDIGSNTFTSLGSGMMYVRNDPSRDAYIELLAYISDTAFVDINLYAPFGDLYLDPSDLSTMGFSGLPAMMFIQGKNDQGDFNRWTFTSDLATSATYSGVPEPATLALLGLGIAGLGFIRRRNIA